MEREWSIRNPFFCFPMGQYLLRYFFNKGQRVQARIHILQVCLSSSWGGLEMVALEMAEYFGAEQLKTCVTSDSILKQKLSEKVFQL